MDMELRKTDPFLLTTITEVQVGSGEDPLSILNNEHKNNEKQTTKTKRLRKRKLETIQEEDQKRITDQL